MFVVQKLSSMVLREESCGCILHQCIFSGGTFFIAGKVVALTVAASSWLIASALLRVISATINAPLFRVAYIGGMTKSLTFKALEWAREPFIGTVDLPAYLESVV